MKAKGSFTFAKFKEEIPKTKFDRFVEEFMFVPVFIIAIWLTAYMCACVCNYCYDESAMPYVFEPSHTLESADLVSTASKIGTSGGMLPDGRLDINAATAEEFQQLEGIGPVKANSIVEARAVLGGFRTVDDLLNVKGIGEKILESIKSFVVVL